MKHAIVREAFERQRLQSENSRLPNAPRQALLSASNRCYGDILGKPHEEARRESEVAVGKLEVGMVLDRGLLAHDGTLLLAADYILDANPSARHSALCSA